MLLNDGGDRRASVLNLLVRTMKATGPVSVSHPNYYHPTPTSIGPSCWGTSLSVHVYFHTLLLLFLYLCLKSKIQRKKLQTKPFFISWPNKFSPE